MVACSSGDLIRLSGVRRHPARLERTRLYGEGLPLDANKGTGLDKISFRLGRAALVVAAGP